MSAPPGAIHVLHVDDEPGFAAMAARFIERDDEMLSVAVATSASEGMDYLRDHEVDCIVSDYEMAEMDGLAFLEAVRANHPDLPFILFTGKGSEEIASEAIASGVSDYLQKTAGSELYQLLANRIRNAVQQHRDARRADELDRIRRVIREVNQAIVRSPNREALETAVCTVISRAEPYRLVWIGEHDPESQTVSPRASAGEGTDYLDDITITTGTGATGRGPTGRAVRNREIAITQSITEDADFEPWAELALERGYLSSAAIPLLFEDTLYGVLNVYSAVPAAFDEKERSLLAELGEDIAHALHRIDREQELRRFREAAENAGHAVYITDTEGTIEYVNPAFERITGYSADTAVGQTPALLNSGEMSSDYFEELWETLLVGDVWEEEVVNRRQSGERYTAYQTIAPITDETGAPTAFVAVQTDITDRHERERELQHERQRYRALLDAVPDPIFVADPAAEVITEVNAAAESLLGRLRDELIGLAPAELHPDDEQHRNLFSDHFRRSRASETGRIILSEFEDGSDILVDPSEGVTIPVEINAGLVEIGDQLLFQGVFRDLSTRRDRERKIERQNERLEAFASLVSHDLRNPLTVASGHLDLVREEIEDPHLEQVKSALDRMAAMIDWFLQWAREGQAVEQPEAVDLSPLLRRCWQNIDGTTAELVVEADVSIEAERSRVQHLFENLFRNAVDHAGPHVTIRVGCLDEGEGLFIEDDGPGIPADQRSTVFETGYSTKESGTGLGLSIVKQIVEAHDWTIELTEADGGGARFELAGVDLIQ